MQPTPPPNPEQMVIEFFTFVISTIADSNFKTAILIISTVVISLTRASTAIKAIWAVVLKLQKMAKAIPGVDTVPPADQSSAHTNGNGNAINALINNMRTQSDAYDALERATESQFREINTRWRRDTDSFYMMFSELRDSDKDIHAIVGNLDDRVVKLESVVFVTFANIPNQLVEILRRLPPPDEMDKAS